MTAGFVMRPLTDGTGVAVLVSITGAEPRLGWLISERVTIVTGRSVTIVRGAPTAGPLTAHSRIAAARSEEPSR